MSIQPSSHHISTSPVVALHSSASSSGQWKKLAADLEGRFEVFAPELPGYKSAFNRENADGNACNQIIAEIEKLGQSVHLVGHSNGGSVALQIALARPDLLNSLTLYEPAAFHFLENSDLRNRELFREIRQLSGLVTASAAMDDPGQAMKMFIDFWNGAGTWQSFSPEMRAKFSGMVVSVMRDFSEGFAQTWSLDDLSALDIPTLVMIGLESPMVAQRASIEIAHAMPDARIALLPELNHMAPVFQPEWVNPRILEHLSNAERPQRTFKWPKKWAA